MELECLQQSQGLIDRASNGQIVDGRLAQNALRINEEQALRMTKREGSESKTKRCERVRDQRTVCALVHTHRSAVFPVGLCSALTSQRNTFLLEEHSIGSRDGLVDVREDGDLK